MNDQSNRKTLKFSPEETKISLVSAFIIALRLFGLFMLLPVFSIYALQLQDATPMNIGITLGLYGLAAMLMQPVFGYISDQHGRLKMIALGLILFISGSLVATFATEIYTMMLGRLLQGMGAIGSVLMALVADHTRPTTRSKAMALIGTFITLGFIIAMVLSPILTQHFGLSGLFALSSLLGCIALALVLLLPQSNIKTRKLAKSTVPSAYFKKLLQNTNTRLINLSVLLLHGVLIANFVVLPNLIRQNLQVSLSASWWVYLLALLPAFILMFCLIIIAEKFQRIKSIVVLCILTISLAELLFFTELTHLAYLITALILFFTAFITLEALLPSWLTRIVSPNVKGTALGIYASCQFLGAFLGGCLGGYLASPLPKQVFLYLTALTALWFIFATRTEVSPLDPANDTKSKTQQGI